MPRKIYDIKPPKLAHKAGRDFKAVLNDEKKKKYHGRRKKEKSSIWKPVSIGIFAALCVIGVYLFFKLPRADIVIWPKVDVLSFEQTITADKSADSVSLENAVIPAKYFETAKNNSQDFPATGNASDEGRATGTITIYNKYDPPTPFSFRAGTRFISDSGKLFVALQKIVVPPAEKSGGKIIPGKVQVEVQAVEGGSDYNIPPSNFSIPGLKGTAYYYSVNATSDSAMTGGYTGKVKKVTDDDIQGAKDILSEKTKSDAVSDLKGQIPSDYILLDNAISSDITSASTGTKSGTVADNFNYKVTAEANALAFKKSDLDQFVKDYIVSQMPEGKSLLDSSLKTDYSVNSLDISGGKEVINLNFSSGVYQDINKNSMALSLLGENADQIKAIINNKLGDQVSEIKINFWPFWVSSAPNNQNAVKVELKFK